MKKRLLSTLLALCFIAVLISSTAPGAAAATEYDLWIGDTQVTDANKADVLGDGTVNFVSTGEYEGTLTLNHADITEGRDCSETISTTDGGMLYEQFAAIYSSYNLNLVCVGENKITVPATDLDRSYGLYAGGITLTGSGSLKITAGAASAQSYGIYDLGELTVADTVELTAIGNKAGYLSAGIQTYSAAISGSAVVTAAGGTAGNSYGIAIDFDGPLTVTDSAVVTATASEGERSYGISVRTAIVSGSCAIVASGCSAATEYAVDLSGYTSPTVTAGASASGASAWNGTTALESFQYVSISAAGTAGDVQQPVSGTFTDVPSGAWYEEYVTEAYDMGLVTGKGNGKYAPDDNMTIAEAITLAVRMHAAFHGITAPEASGSPWYTPYLEYAAEVGIPCEYSDFNAKITREEYIHIFYAAVLDVEYVQINSIPDGAIPDVPMTHKYADEIYSFYRDGILTGSDSSGTFNPLSNIKRCEVAAILCRINGIDQQEFTLG